MSALKHISHNDWTNKAVWPLAGCSQTLFLLSFSGLLRATFTMITEALYEACTQLKRATQVFTI